MTRTKISSAARIVRAVADVCTSPYASMPVAVVGSIDIRTDFQVVAQAAKAIDVKLVTVELPVGGIGQIQEIGDQASRNLSLTTGPKIILILASDYEENDLHRDIIAGAAGMAKESFSVDGETYLLVVSDVKEPIARLIGETLKRTDWASFIHL